MPVTLAAILQKYFAGGQLDIHDIEYTNRCNFMVKLRGVCDRPTDYQMNGMSLFVFV